MANPARETGAIEPGSVARAVCRVAGERGYLLRSGVAGDLGGAQDSDTGDPIAPTAGAGARVTGTMLALPTIPYTMKKAGQKVTTVGQHDGSVGCGLGDGLGFVLAHLAQAGGCRIRLRLVVSSGVPCLVRASFDKTSDDNKTYDNKTTTWDCETRGVPRGLSRTGQPQRCDTPGKDGAVESLRLARGSRVRRSVPRCASRGLRLAALGSAAAGRRWAW